MFIPSLKQLLNDKDDTIAVLDTNVENRTFELDELKKELGQADSSCKDASTQCEECDFKAKNKFTINLKAEPQNYY